LDNVDKPSARSFQFLLVKARLNASKAGSGNVGSPQLTTFLAFAVLDFECEVPSRS